MSSTSLSNAKSVVLDELNYKQKIVDEEKEVKQIIVSQMLTNVDI